MLQVRMKERTLVSLIKFVLNLAYFDDEERGYWFHRIFKNIVCEKKVFLRRNITFYGKGNLYIGEGSFINEECFFDMSSKIYIGKNVAIGMRTIVLSSSHKIGATKRCGSVRRMVTKIADNVWIGANVVIYPGIVIEEGAVIAAGEVVRKNVPSNMLFKNGKISLIDEKKVENV